MYYGHRLVHSENEISWEVSERMSPDATTPYCHNKCYVHKVNIVTCICRITTWRRIYLRRFSLFGYKIIFIYVMYMF